MRSDNFRSRKCAVEVKFLTSELGTSYLLFGRYSTKYDHH